QALGKLQDERAVGPLAQRLTDPALRAEVSGALQKMGPAAEKEVVKLMNHPDFLTRAEARRLVRDYGTRENVIIPQMLADLDAPDVERRRAAADWLANARPDPMNQAKVALALMKTLQDGDPRVQGGAARALEVWAGRNNIEALIGLVNDQRSPE